MFKNSKKTNNRATTVYWACIQDEWMRAEPPTSALSRFMTSVKEPTVIGCPAIKKSLSNVYELHSLYSYNFKIEGDTLQSDVYDQNFYESHVVVRSLPERIFSFNMKFIFFTEEDSLLMTGNIPPYLENNNITKRCIPIPGAFDIGKWFRPVEFGFILKPEYDTFIIENDEIYQYVQFHTESKINLVQFYPSAEIGDLLKATDSSRDYRRSISNLSYFYKSFKLKDKILKEIKKNIL